MLRNPELLLRLPGAGAGLHLGPLVSLKLRSICKGSVALSQHSRAPSPPSTTEGSLAAPSNEGKGQVAHGRGRALS